MTGLDVVYMGTPDFAVPALDAVIAAGHRVACVYTQPPRPAGRGHKERRSAVHTRADELGLPVRCPESLKDAGEQAAFAELGADVAVVAAYGLILPPPVLTAPRLGCLNIHASLLPRWRGAAPIQHAILAGDGETGITIMQMDEGLDTGPILRQERIAIGEAATAATLHDELATLGARALTAVLAEMPAATPQDEAAATYAGKLSRADGRLDWTQPAADLARRVRAFDPWPGTWCALDGETLRVLEAEGVTGDGTPGAVLDGPGLVVACGDGHGLRLRVVQRPGKKPMADTDFLRGLRHRPATAGP
jgi:methionyl-tRNA formyltransferase